MPTYEYACIDCGQHVEVFQRFTDDALTTCGVCGGRLRKVFHPAGIMFKGSGFYRTDNRKGRSSEGDGSTSSSKPAASTTSSSGSGGSSGSSGSSGSESKSATGGESRGKSA